MVSLSKINCLQTGNSLKTDKTKEKKEENLVLLLKWSFEDVVTLEIRVVDGAEHVSVCACTCMIACVFVGKHT